MQTERGASTEAPFLKCEGLTQKKRGCIMQIYAVYFSPTGTTQKITEYVARQIAAGLRAEFAGRVDLTRKEARDQERIFGAQDMAVIGLPVYAGRVPNVLLPCLHSLQGSGAKAVCISVYGNRHYDDALLEFTDLMQENGFGVIGAGAFVGEHSFSAALAAGRPDDADMEVARDFADRLIDKIERGDRYFQTAVKGERPYRPYYMPKDQNGNPVDIRKVKPKTGETCTGCMLCVKVCPMDSIDRQDPALINGICVKCGACIKKCPSGAKYYDDSGYLNHQYELEEGLKERKEPELFL